MASIKRRVGYCENSDCEVYGEEIFLRNDDGPFHCRFCGQLGQVENRELAIGSGETLRGRSKASTHLETPGSAEPQRVRALSPTRTMKQDSLRVLPRTEDEKWIMVGEGFRQRLDLPYRVVVAGLVAWNRWYR